MKTKKITLAALFFAALLAMSLSVFAASPSLKLVKHSGRTYTISMKCPGLKKSYKVDQEKTVMRRLEFKWGFKFTDGKTTYSVSTLHFKLTKKPKTMKVVDMQSNLWKERKNGGSSVDKTTVKQKGTTLTWTFTVPKSFKQAKFKVTSLETCVSGKYSTKEVSIKIK